MVKMTYFGWVEFCANPPLNICQSILNEAMHRWLVCKLSDFGYFILIISFLSYFLGIFQLSNPLLYVGQYLENHWRTQNKHYPEQR